MAFVIFAITLAPGMAGGKLGELDAYVPVAEDADRALWMKDDLAGALAKAKAEGKRVLVNFTGYACTNCHWMKANMFTRAEIAGLLKDLVLVDLYTDGDDAASQANQKLEESKFGTIAIPFYVLYDSDQNVIATFADLTRDVPKFAAFLNTRGALPILTTAATGSDLDSLPLTTLAGAAFDRSPYKGKPVVVDFWATWCVPCRQEIPGFNKLSASGVAVVGASLDEEGAKLVTPFLKEHPMNYPVALGPQSIYDTLKIAQLPTTVIYDAAGKLVERFEGATEIAKIEAAVKNLK